MGHGTIDRIRRSAVTAVEGRFFYGWVIVFVAGFGMFSSGPGHSYTFGVFFDPIGTDLGVSKASLATAYGLATLAAALMLPRIGGFVDRRGPRKGMLLIAAALGLSCLFLGAAVNFLWLSAGFALMRLFGQGGMMMGSANLTSQWFGRHRGLAMSLMALGFGASMAIHPPLSQYLVDEIGWRGAWFVLGLLTWISMVPPLLLLAFDKPEDVDLRPDGRSAPVDEAGRPERRPDIPGLTLGEALGGPTFYILALGWFAIGMLLTTLHVYQVGLLTDRGLGRQAAAGLFTVSALTMVCAIPLVGRMFDRLRTRYVIALALVVTAACLVGITAVDSLAAGVAYATLFGFANALGMTMFGYIWPRYFGRRHLGEIQGVGQMVGAVGASLGPLPVGLAYDFLGGADAVLWILAVFSLAAAVLTLVFLRTPAGLTESAHLE